MTISHHKFHYGNNLIDYSLIRSKRLKTSEVIVDENGVIIRVPNNKPDSEIENILRRKGQWIIDKRQKYHNAKKQIKKSSFEIGSTLPYLGKNYRIAKDSHNSNGYLELRKGQFLVSGNNMSDMYKRWLMQKSDKTFHSKVAKYSDKLKVKPPRIIAKNMRNRWGSITRDGVLNLNVNLLKAPTDVIDYVIVHELCHFRIKSHSHHFWNFLGKIIPNYRDHILWLESNASLLIQ